MDKPSVRPTTPSEPSRSEAIARFRDHGLKTTPQRLAIYRALVRMKDHPSPELLFRSVRPALPALSLGTVYKALDALEAAGLVEQVSRIGDTKRYDGNLDPHHHLVCTRCRRVIDVMLPDDQLPQASPALINAGQRGFKVTGVHVQFLGTCQDCVEEEKR